MAVVEKMITNRMADQLDLEALVVEEEVLVVMGRHKLQKLEQLIQVAVVEDKLDLVQVDVDKTVVVEL